MAKYFLVRAFAFASALTLLAAPAGALNMLRRNAAVGCSSLVDTAHPGLAGKPRDVEIRKCKQDPAAYNKAAGF